MSLARRHHGSGSPRRLAKKGWDYERYAAAGVRRVPAGSRPAPVRFWWRRCGRRGHGRPDSVRGRRSKTWAGRARGRPGRGRGRWRRRRSLAQGSDVGQEGFRGSGAVGAGQDCGAMPVSVGDLREGVAQHRNAIGNTAADGSRSRRCTTGRADFMSPALPDLARTGRHRPGAGCRSPRCCRSGRGRHWPSGVSRSAHRPGAWKPFRYQKAAAYQIRAIAVTRVPPASGSAQPGQWRWRTTMTLATKAP